VSFFPSLVPAWVGYRADSGLATVGYSCVGADYNGHDGGDDGSGPCMGKGRDLNRVECRGTLPYFTLPHRNKNRNRGSPLPCHGHLPRGV
jgi:hypothetical protein